MAGWRFIIAADRLSRSGSGWDDFIQAFEEEVALAATTCVQSPLEVLQVNQGRAQSMAALLKVLKTCRVEAEKLRGKPTPPTSPPTR